jgi:hypothetical protein
VVLTGREKTNMPDTDVVVGWMLYTTTGALMVKREREI